jgi:soluble lytic murein transglycosylase-like protein
MKIIAPLLLFYPAFVSAFQAQTDAQRQQSGVLAMQESIARQRASVQKQSGATAAGSFFVLPPPSRTEGMVASASAMEPECAPLPESEARSLVGQAATREGLDAELLFNVMRQESAFRPCAVSAKGAMGLMQLMPATAEQLGVKDSFDPLENVSAGAKFLKELLARYNGDVFKAVSAYNAGPARVDASGGIPQIPETIDYLNHVLYPLMDKQ